MDEKNNLLTDKIRSQMGIDVTKLRSVYITVFEESKKDKDDKKSKKIF